MLRTLTSRLSVAHATTKNICRSVGPLRLASTVEAPSQNEQESAEQIPIHVPLWLENNLKLKVEEKASNETYVEAIKTEEDPDYTPLKPCILCRLNIKNLQYTDVMILSQFIKKNGKLQTYHESRLCPKQYHKIQRLIRQAQRCNLIDRPSDYFVPGLWHNLNTYIERDRLRDQPTKIIKQEYWNI